MAKNEFICDCNVIHQDIVDKTLKQMKNEGNIIDMVSLGWDLCNWLGLQ